MRNDAHRLPYQPPPEPPPPAIVPVGLGERSYQIIIQPGSISRAGELLKGLLPGRRLLVVTDLTVGPLFGPALAKSLTSAGFNGEIVQLPPGEGAKSWTVANQLYDRCFEAQLNRSSCLVALGGGVIGDLTGFVAATFMRGIAFLQVPTTLLAMVDAAIGGKTAIDHPKAKNAIGAFHQPCAVCIDPLVLEQLPEREFKAGLAEVIKYGILGDESFFCYLEERLAAVLQRDPEVVGHLVQRSCQIKARIVSQDEREQEGGPRALLNFGHTFAHALESCCEYKGYLHGEAVAIGMALAAELSVRRGLLVPEAAARIRTLLERTGLPVALRAADPAAEALHQATFRDKKNLDGKLRFVLATAIGTTLVCGDVPAAEALAVWKALPRVD